MTQAGDGTQRRGREATTAAILDAAQELFSSRGYSAVTVRDIARRAGVTHPLVHQYVGSKADVFRAVLTRNEGLILAAASDHLDLLETTIRMLRQGLNQPGRAYARLIVRQALNGVPYDRTIGNFDALERLVELATSAADSASPAERAAKRLDPRFVIACVVMLFLAWSATETWVLPALGLKGMEESEGIAGLEHVILSILKDNVPGVERDEPATL
jgi:AcrR family transcriptional regulator